MNRSSLIDLIKTKRSFLCIGLDTDLSKIPEHLQKKEDPAFEFNKAIIDATIDLTVAYKPNLAFYECNGVKGWNSLTKTIQYINNTYPGKAFSMQKPCSILHHPGLTLMQ
jgi:orotidine-5'-phosphate decarboxylase